MKRGVYDIIGNKGTIPIQLQTKDCFWDSFLGRLHYKYNKDGFNKIYCIGLFFTYIL